MSKRDQNDGEVFAMTIAAIKNSHKAFDEFDKMFRACSDSFEQGDDKDGIDGIIEDIVPRLLQFNEFLANVIRNTDDAISNELKLQLAAKCDIYSQVMGRIVEKMEHKNYIEVGDILRFDMSELMQVFKKLFAELTVQLENRK